MNVYLNGNLAEISAKHIFFFITPKKCINRDKKVYLNENLAQLLVNHIFVLLTPKKQAKFIWPNVSLLCIKMQHEYLCYKVVNNQTPSPQTRC